MRLIYDQAADALEIVLIEDESVQRTEQLDAGTLVDVDALGRALSVEVIQPARGWPLEGVLERFDLSPSDATMLRSLWSHGFPYESHRQVTSGLVVA